MIDDFGGGQPERTRRKPKTIQPIEKPAKKPLPVFDDELSENEPVFKEPNIVADGPEPSTALADSDKDTSTETTGSTRVAKKLSAIRRPFTDWHWPLNKKWTIIASSIVAVLLIGGAATAYKLTRYNVASGVHTSKKPAAPAKKVTVIYSSLTGLPVADASVNQRPVTGVMIENSTDARPQSGIDQAGIVFEAIAEGGITRFLTLYQDTQPDYLGPVRSARPYYVQWCMSFDCSLAHVGGSPEALQNITDWGTKNLDQFYNAGAYQRITSRYAPHNVYTSMSQLNQLETAKNYGASSYTAFPRKNDKPYVVPAPAAPATPGTKTSTKATATDTRTPATSIDFAISSYYYNAHFDYDAAHDTYLRSQAGAPHMIAGKDGGQVQIQPKVVVALVMQYGLEADDHHSQYNVVGSGQAFIFQDGTVTQGTWSKSGTKGPLVLTDAKGVDLALNRGQTWITALSAASQATYK